VSRPTPAWIAAAPIRIGTAAIAGWSAYLTGLIRRGAGPCTLVEDATRFTRVLTSTSPPRWATDWPVVAEWPLGRLRDCGVPEVHGDEAHGDGVHRDEIPTLLLPPHSGTHSCIVDHSPGRSQVEALRAGGLTRLHCLEWAPATPETNHCSIDEHLAVVDAAIRRLGGQVHLIGDSQGGWLGAIHAALHPETVRTLTVAGAPIDFHVDQPALTALADLPAGAGASALDVWYGTARALGLPATDPVGELERAMTLLGHLDDPEAVRRWEAEHRWFSWRQEIPVAFREWIMRHLFVGNDLVAGRLVAEGRRVDLSAVHCPVHLIAGRHDPVATPRQVAALAAHVATPRSAITTTVVDDGHIGLFVGRRALAQVWTPHARRLLDS